MRFRYEETSDVELLIGLFERNDIEVAEDEFSDGFTHLIKAFAVFDEEAEGKAVGAVALVTRLDRTVINGIAVDKEYRREGLARVLLKMAMDEAKRIGAKTIWIVARAPLFFAAQGFEYITEDQVPKGLFDCLVCSQYNKICFPKLMKYDF